MKFQIGDRVKIRKEFRTGFTVYVGEIIGVVYEKLPCEYYQVLLDGCSLPCAFYKCHLMDYNGYEDFLERIEERML